MTALNDDEFLNSGIGSLFFLRSVYYLPFTQMYIFFLESKLDSLSLDEKLRGRPNLNPKKWVDLR